MEVRRTHWGIDDTGRSDTRTWYNYSYNLEDGFSLHSSLILFASSGEIARSSGCEDLPYGVVAGIL